MKQWLPFIQFVAIMVGSFFIGYLTINGHDWLAFVVMIVVLLFSLKS